MKLAGGVIDGLVKGPYFYFPSREVIAIFPSSHFVDKRASGK